MTRALELVRRRWRRLIAIAIALVLLPVVALVVAAMLTKLPDELREGPPSASIVVVDRDGHLLREVRASDGTHARWVPLAEVSQSAKDALIATEDRRFFIHRGVDPIAIARAIGSSLWHRRVVSGASTITMQLARTIHPRKKSLVGKFLEMALAIRIEASLSKERILEEYLNRVPYGPNLRGIGAASEAYFGKPPAKLSVGESALLAGIVRGPSLYAPDKDPLRARARRSTVLARMVESGTLTEAARALADGEPVVTITPRARFGAPHFVQGLVGGGLRALQPGLTEQWSTAARIETTIDASLQREAETTVRVVLQRLKERNVTAASVVVIDNATGDVLAWVGSPDVFDAARLGANDGVVGLRQPGSALKPFLYALAMETKGFTPATVLPDVELRIATPGGTWVPKNYDETFHGPVRLREALGSSLNVPAAWTIQQVGVDPFLQRLRALGIDSLQQSADYYGPALSLGDGEVKLVALANAYATLARGGVSRPLRLVRSLTATSGARVIFEPSTTETRVMPAGVTDMVTDMLKDRRARLASFGDVTPLDFAFEVAAKTGTSKGFRDNWTFGFSSAVTVGVWVGNFDGSPMQEVSGISGAAPIFQAVMEAAMRGRQAMPLPRLHDSNDGRTLVTLCALSGAPATTLCPQRVREWLTEDEVAAIVPSVQHVAVRIDKRNGLRAGSACTAEETETRVYESHAPAYVAWATAAKRPIVPVESSPFCPAPALVGIDSPGTLAIRAPLDGTKLVIDPDRPRALQVLTIDVVAPSEVGEVTLRIDGKPFATHKAPFTFGWPIEKGTHVLVAEAKGAPPTAPITVHVRE